MKPHRYLRTPRGRHASLAGILARFSLVVKVLVGAFTAAAHAQTQEVFAFHGQTADWVVLVELSQTPLPQCQAECAARADCAGYSEGDDNACLLLSGFTDVALADPMNTNLTSLWVKRQVDLVATAAARRQDMEFLGPALLELADALRAGPDEPLTGETYDSLFYGPYPQGVEDMFSRADLAGEEGLWWASDAYAKTLAALALTDRSDQWVEAGETLLGAALAMTELRNPAQLSLTAEIYDASLATAITAYILSVDDEQSQVALYLLSAALFANDHPDLSRHAFELWAKLVKPPDGTEFWQAIAGATNEEPPLTRKDLLAFE